MNSEPGSDLQRLIKDVVDNQYGASMRRYLVDCFSDAYGPEWFDEVVSRQLGRQGRKKLGYGVRTEWENLKKDVDSGHRNPAHVLEVKHFQFVVEEHEDALPRKLVKAKRSMDIVRDVRNQAEHEKDTLSEKVVAQLLLASSNVLEHVDPAMAQQHEIRSNNFLPTPSGEDPLRHIRYLVRHVLGSATPNWIGIESAHSSSPSVRAQGLEEAESAARDIERLRRGSSWPLKWPFFGGALSRLRTSEATQSGLSGGGGRPSAATQEGTDDGGHALPVREGEDQRALTRRRLLVAIAAVIAIPIVSYVVYASSSPGNPPPLTPPSNTRVEPPPPPPPPPPPLTPPVIDALTCKPEKPKVGKDVTCFASLSGGEPDSWLWRGGGEPPSGSDPTSFTTTFSSPGDRQISLTVENTAGSNSRSFAIEVVSTPTSLSSGASYSCYITDDSAAACWGLNGYGERDVLDGRFMAISAGGAHTCGLRESGAVVCWGWNKYGQKDWPLDRFLSISAGLRHTCGITTDKTVKCWGWNEHGQSVDRDGQYSQVSAGFFHNCAVMLDGGVECWGAPGHKRTQPPDGSFTTVSAGSDHTCGLRPKEGRVGSRVECWGSGKASGSPDGLFTTISAGEFHNCGILASGAVRCWGNDDRGQLAAPTENDFVQIDAGALHTCATRTNGEIVCWGNTAHRLDDVNSAVIGDHMWQGKDPPPEPVEQEPPCPVTDEDGNCPTSDEAEASDSGSGSLTETGDGQDELDDDEGGLQPTSSEPRTTLIIIPTQEPADGDLMSNGE